MKIDDYNSQKGLTQDDYCDSIVVDTIAIVIFKEAAVHEII